MSHEATANLHALSVRSAEQEVYEALRLEIIHGLQPDTPLRLKSLAERFDISTMPIRAALARLQSEGLVVQRPRRGAVVARLSESDFVDLYAIRMALEGVAARFGAPLLSRATILQMKAQLAEMGALSERDVNITDDYLPMDWQLHDLCYRAASRPRLLELIDVYRRQSERYFRHYLGHRLDLGVDVRGQAHFVEACEARDADAAEAAIRQLFTWTMERVLPVLPEEPSDRAHRQASSKNRPRERA